MYLYFRGDLILLSYSIRFMIPTRYQLNIPTIKLVNQVLPETVNNSKLTNRNSLFILYAYLPFLSIQLKTLYVLLER